MRLLDKVLPLAIVALLLCSCVRAAPAPPAWPLSEWSQGNATNYGSATQQVGRQALVRLIKLPKLQLLMCKWARSCTGAAWSGTTCLSV